MKSKFAIIVLVLMCLTNVLLAQKNVKLEVLTNLDLYEYCKIEGLIEEVFEPNSKVVKDKFDYILGISVREFREKQHFFKRSVHYHYFFEKLSRIQSNKELFELYNKYPTMKTFTPEGLTFDEFKDYLEKGEIRIYQINPKSYHFVENNKKTLKDIPINAKPIAAKDFKATIEK